MDDFNAWTIGAYIQRAVASVMSKKAKYPKEPFTQQKQNCIVVTEDMSEEQKLAITQMLFGELEEMQSKFEAHKVLAEVD